MRREADWNDWRYFLVVARAGSTLTAARELRVSQTTVACRVAALEEALGVPLFERRPAGYVLTGASVDLSPQAAAIEQAALSAEQRALARGREASGCVRFTSEDIFVIGLLAPTWQSSRGDLRPCASASARHRACATGRAHASAGRPQSARAGGDRLLLREAEAAHPIPGRGTLGGQQLSDALTPP